MPEYRKHEPRLRTTPFGRRSVSLVHVASQAIAKQRPLDKAVHKWTVFRAICAAKTRLGLTERALSVLDALLSFHPETALIGENLIVFPSNEQLALRAHGMPPSTLRRHSAVLVDSGVIIRRDSPNGKRYARKGQGRPDQPRLRLRSRAAGRPRRRIRGSRGRDPRCRPGAAACSRTHHAASSRHRQDDRDGDRGGRPDAQHRAGPRRLG